ncbi:MAG: hypothetical protein MJY76_01585 [Bacteroidales bacterium]|nr:hypothetical protein [Bacteroidales bacterium]
MELLKTYSLNIAEGHSSPTIRLEDEVGGDMFFTITLMASSEKDKPGIYFQIEDEFHAGIKVVVEANKYSSLPNPVRIGTYKNKQDLLLNVLAKPIGGNMEHEIVVSFYLMDKGNGTR